MKKILVITPFLNDKNELLKEFLFAGIKESFLTIFVYQRKNENNLIYFIRKNRPKMIILDGRMNYIPLGIIHDLIENLIGTYDMDSKIYAIKEFVNFRGINNIEIKDVPKIKELP